MSTPLLKDLYSPEFYMLFTDVLKKVIPSLDKAAFSKAIFSAQWTELELKDRMKHTTTVLHESMPSSFPAAAKRLVQLTDELEAAGMTTQRLEFMFLPDYIEQYGINDFRASIEAIERVTQFTSCEFAVRPFIIKYESQMMDKMIEWSTHPHEEVRRLASEGCRPRLPWAMALPGFKQDPAPVLPILENLKEDPSLYVRRSVANNLNDISKDHPTITLNVCESWQGKHADTDWIIKHACRTLLRAGNSRAMQLFGFSAPEHIRIADFSCSADSVAMGHNISFTFSVHHKLAQPTRIRLEFGMYFLRANGSHSRKVFMIGEKTLGEKELWKVEKGFSFKPLSTRRYYPGEQKIALIVNGVELLTRTFELTES